MFLAVIFISRSSIYFFFKICTISDLLCSIFGQLIFICFVSRLFLHGGSFTHVVCNFAVCEPIFCRAYFSLEILISLDVKEENKEGEKKKQTTETVLELFRMCFHYRF